VAGTRSIFFPPAVHLLPFICSFCIAGVTLFGQTEIRAELPRHFIPDPEQVLSRIAFGSCNMESKAQPMWRWIAANEPELWIWGGDNIYGDSRDPAVLAAKYRERKTNPAYRYFISKHPVIGTWDDHDYGENDADGSFPIKKESRDLLFEFLDIPLQHPAWQREGAYLSYRFGPPGRRVAILLLDVRYFRDARGPFPNDDYGNTINPTGDMLGEAQWTWLEEELCYSDADIHFLVSGVQILPFRHKYEKWADFPLARQRLIDLIAACGPERLVFLTGDRHLAEITAGKVDGFGTIIEFTSSGMTHTRSADAAGDNPERIGMVVDEKNFGLITIYWEEDPIRMELDIRGLENELFQRVTIRFP
jgi:alkaline phosphatase D